MKIPRICTIRQFLKIGKHEGGPLSVQFILNLSSAKMKMNKMTRTYTVYKTYLHYTTALFGDIYTDCV